MRVLITSGSRGEWGYYTPVIEEFKRLGISYDILCANMAAVPEFGSLVDLIEAEGEEVRYKIYSSFHGGDHYAMAKSFSSLAASLADIMHNNRYDWVLIAGDRFEQFAVASICNFMSIPLAHIQAGEKSGNVDGVTRHAIGKLAHLHFAANWDAYNRLVKLGEEAERVRLTGAPQLDELFDYFEEDKNITPGESILAIYHGLTEDPRNNFIGLSNMISELTEWLPEYKINYIMPNNDAGGNDIREYITLNKRDHDSVFVNVPRREFCRLMANSRFMIGNSSSGLLEAPVYKKIAINIGGRQRDRVAGDNVIHAEFKRKSIGKAIQAALEQTADGRISCDSPYGSAPAAPKIVEAMLEWSARGRAKILDRRITL